MQLIKFYPGASDFFYLRTLAQVISIRVIAGRVVSYLCQTLIQKKMKNKQFTERIGTPLRPYSAEREAELEQIKLEAFRSILNRPNLSVQEMREMNEHEPDDTIEVIFFKKKRENDENSSLRD